MTSRLEHKGVLLSWAVPKGPSLDPKTKRLTRCTSRITRSSAARFRRRRPQGYGAGIVMLWDQGTWKPRERCRRAALKRGDLKFTLDGYQAQRLVGARANGRMGFAGAEAATDGSWLLIKHRDDWAGELDITGVRAQERQERRGLSRISWRPTSRMCGNRIVRQRAARPEDMLEAIIEKAAALKAGRAPAGHDESGAQEGRTCRGRIEETRRQKDSSAASVKAKRSPRRANPSRERNERDA